MKTNNRSRKSASISKIRWAAYAAAGAATALGGSHSLEAAIHYSGRLGVPLRDDDIEFFPLDQVFSLVFIHQDAYAAVRMYPPFSNSFRGYEGSPWLSKLNSGENISAGHFTHITTSYDGVLAGYVKFPFGQFTDPGRGFIGFRFESDAGTQYGWARVKMAGADRANKFKVLDFAYADPGEPIRAGQTSSDEQAPDQGSLGWLALGGAGLLAWRKRRSRMASLK